MKLQGTGGLVNGGDHGIDIFLDRPAKTAIGDHGDKNKDHGRD